MKTTGHPQYNTKATITCNSCGTVYVLGSTTDSLKVELCAHCHPYYTGKEVLVDTDNLVELYNKKKLKAEAMAKGLANRKEKDLKRRKSGLQSKPLTLRDMLSNIK